MMCEHDECDSPGPCTDCTECNRSKHVEDSADDGPEIDLINFFHFHPQGHYGIESCMH